MLWYTICFQHIFFYISFIIKICNIEIFKLKVKFSILILNQEHSSLISNFLTKPWVLLME
jgi:hypothetical protein